MMKYLIFILFAFMASMLHAGEKFILRAQTNQNVESYLSDPEIAGISTIYYWSELEPRLGQFDFSAIDRDLALVRRYHKSLFIMVRDKSFRNNPVMPVPAELGHLVSGETSKGYLANRWDKTINAAFRNLILNLGARYNTEPDFRGFKTSETAPGLRLPDADAQKAYVENLGLVIQTMAKAFPDKETYFYMNWGPKGYEAIKYWGDMAVVNGVGLGGPDIHPDVNMPSYRYFKLVRGQAKIMMDVQFSNYSHGTPEELRRFGTDVLGAGILAWLPVSGYDLSGVLAQ